MERSTDSHERIFHSALIVDDHPLFCDALSMTLGAVANIRDIQTAANLTDALSLIGTGFSPDLVVLDLNLPDVDGLDGLIRMRNTASVPVVVVSSMADNRVITSTIKAGASGFVPKHSKREIFAAAIKSIRQGHIFVPDGFVLLD